MSRTPTRSVHPEREMLTAALFGGGSEKDPVGVEDHLRSPCVHCLLAARDVVRVETQSSRRGLVAGLFDKGLSEARRRDALDRYLRGVRVRSLLLEAEEKAAPGLMAELMLRSPAARREAVRTTRRYQLFALSEFLRAESRQEGFRDVARALELAELSAEVAECLDTEFYGIRLVADVRALGWAIIGNARRVGSDLFGAERALRSAYDLHERGTAGLTEEAEILSLLASLRTDQSRFSEAIKLMERAVKIYRHLGLQHLEGKALLQMGRAAGHDGEHLRAVELLGKAISLLEGANEAHMVFLARHSVAAFLNDAGRSAEAALELAEIEREADRFPEDRSTHIHRRWIEGRVWEGQGDLVRAARILRDVQGIFAEEDRAFDNALVTLDLAAVYLQMGETAEVQRLAEELYPVFRSQDVHRHAVAALILFKQAAATEAATVGLVRDLSRYLTRARNNPYLKYEPSEVPN